jgi:hypothetical protein
MDSMLATLCTGFRRIRVTNTTNSGGFSTRTLTATEPTGSGNAVAQTTFGIIDLVGGMGPNLASSDTLVTHKNRAKIIPFGTGGDNSTFDMRIYGWHPVFENTGYNQDKVLWLPFLLGEFTATLSAQVGATGKSLLSTERLADTIVIASTSANQGVSIDVVSIANDTGAHIIVDLKGAWKLECTFNLGTATAANCLVGFY